MVLNGNNSTTNLQQQQNASTPTTNDNCGGITASQLDISGSGTQQQPNAVLRVIIDNMIYPVTLDILYSVKKFFVKNKN